MPYLDELEDDNCEHKNSKIERSYKIHNIKKRTNTASKIVKIITRALFICLFVSCIVPYCIKNYAYSIYLGKIINRNIKVEIQEPVYDKIEIHPFLSDKQRVENIDYLVSPTSDYLNNGSLFGRNFVAKSNIESKNFAKIVSSGKMSVLEERISNLAKKYPELAPRVFVFSYKTGKTAEINSNIPTPLASTVKIPVLFEMFRQIEGKNRDISINKEIIFEDIYRSSGSGDLQYSPKNGKYTLDRIANLMITKSDNSATNLILDEIGGMEDLNRAYRMWGLKTAKISKWLPDLGGENRMSAKEMGDILYNLDNPNFLNSQSREKIREYMGSLATEHLLKAGIASDAKIIHKTGDIGKALSDCGIVTLKNGDRYIVTVIVERPHNSHKARELIESISKETYNYIANL